jgi:hypothetical protein
MKTPYDPAQVVVTWGPYLLSGFMDGTFINVQRDEDAFFKKIGADGEVSRTRNRNRGGSATFTLKHTSSSNDALSAEAVNDELLGTGIYPLLVKDLFGTTLRHAPHAWVKKVADAEFAKEESGREWILDCDQILGTVGGHPDQ